MPGGRPVRVALPERAIRVLVEEVEGTWETSSLSVSIGTKLPPPRLDCDIVLEMKVRGSYLFSFLCLTTFFVIVGWLSLSTLLRSRFL